MTLDERRSTTFGVERGNVSGSRDNVTGTAHQQNDYTNTNPSGGGVNAYDFTFTGRFDGDEQITGSLTVVRNVRWRTSDGSYAGTSHGSVSYQVILRKQ